MGNYSKLIGSIVGALAGVAVNLGIPAELTGAAMQGAIVVVLSGLVTYLFPANKAT